MTTVTIDRETGEVVIRCSMEEAMALEVALVTSSTGASCIEDRTHHLWDELDEIRKGLMKESPSAIPLEIRRCRDDYTATGEVPSHEESLAE